MKLEVLGTRLAVYKITAGHWPFSEQISKVANQNLNQLIRTKLTVWMANQIDVID